MIKVAAFVFGLAATVWVQARYLAPIRSRKEWIVLIGLMTLVAIVGAPLILGLSVPSPMSGLRGIFEPIGMAILH